MASAWRAGALLGTLNAALVLIAFVAFGGDAGEDLLEVWPAILALWVGSVLCAAWVMEGAPPAPHGPRAALRLLGRGTLAGAGLGAVVALVIAPFPFAVAIGAVVGVVLGLVLGALDLLLLAALSAGRP